MKTKISKAWVFVTSKYKSEGSVLKETVKAAGVGFSSRFELESDELADEVGVVVRNAENGCYVMQCLLNPVFVERKVSLNGLEFSPQELSNKPSVIPPAR